MQDVERCLQLVRVLASLEQLLCHPGDERNPEPSVAATFTVDSWMLDAEKGDGSRVY